MSANNNNRQFLGSQITWIGLSFGLSLAISMLVPFPISIVAILAVFILVNYYVRRRTMKTMGTGGSWAGRLGTFGRTNDGGGILKYYCMNCGTPHREPACPKCGSKMKRVGS